MVDRCHGARPEPNYNGLGITVCDEWRDTPTAFFKWSDENGYKPGLSLDRIDPAGNYEPSNCRWIPPEEQAANRKNTVPITAWGETKPLGRWIHDARCTVCATTLRRRVAEGGWTGEDMLTVRVTHKPPAKKRRGAWFYSVPDMELVECLEARGYDCGKPIVKQIETKYGLR